METIANILRRKGRHFNIVSPFSSVRTALHQMNCENLDFLIVMEDDRFLGIVSEHDITKKMTDADLNLNQALVKDFMCTNLPLVTENDTIVYAMHLIEKHNVRHLAVYDGYQFLGVISAMDILSQTLRKRKAVFEEELSEQAYPWHY
ncbi:MAG: CBS domain-containing protein [Flavisolibacter sp.]|nr:CBS domain-containing protein [Flavisolibacter sp.]